MGSGRSAPAQPVRDVYPVAVQVAYPKPAAQPAAYGGPPAYSAGSAPYGTQQPPAGQMAYGQGQPRPGPPNVAVQNPTVPAQQGQRTDRVPAPEPPQQPPLAAAAPGKLGAAPHVHSESSSDDSDDEDSGAVSERHVAKYIELDRKIRALEQSNVEAAYRLKQQDVARLSANVIALQQKVNEANAKCAKEKTDVDTVVRANGNASALYALGLGDITKEQQEYVAALTELDMAKRELDTTQQALDALKVEMGPLKDAYMKILDLKDDQEKILNKIFKGSYGSVKENQLEKEVDFYWDRQQRIKLASSKWLSSRAHVMEACQQLSAGCKKWTEIPMTPGSNDTHKGPVATQARNYFIAAIQNFNFAQNCLSTIRFPYCHSADLATLDLAVKNVYLDIRMPERHHQVYNGCYLAMYNRAVGLLHWFDQVIAGTIEKDFKDSTALVSRKMRELHNERVRLMIEDLQRQGYSGQLPELRPDEPPPTSTVASAPLASSVQPVAVQDENGKPVVTPKADLDSAPPQLPAPTSATVAATEELSSAPPPMPGSDDLLAAGGGPIPLDKLAPPPSKEDLFGDVQELFTKHAEDMKEIERINDVNKARQEQDLADKLASRRSRKMKQMEQMQAATGAAPAV